MSQTALTRSGGLTMAPSSARARSASMPPTVVDVREGLRSTLQPADFERVWSEVCSAGHVATDATELTADQLDTLLRHLATQDHLCRVMAMSWRIRATAARKLTQLGR